MKKQINVGSLFAGVGGICLGFDQAKTPKAEYKLVWANEMDEYACETYRTNFSHTLIQGDITKVLRPEKVDIEIQELQEEIGYLEAEIEHTDAVTVYENLNRNIEQMDRLAYIIRLIERTNKIDAVKKQVKKLSEKLEKDEVINNLEVEVEQIKEQLLEPAMASLQILRQQRDQQVEYYQRQHEIILSEKIDVLNGGFPCQAFSIAGEQKGFEDERGNLFLAIIDLIMQLDEIHGKPRVLFLENVKNLKSHDGGRTYSVIKQELEKIGYKIFEQVLNTMSYSDLPQNRERIYIVGFLDEEDAKEFNVFQDLDKFKRTKTSLERAEDVKKIIDYSLTKEKAPKYYYTKEKYPQYFIDEEKYENIKDNKKGTRINLDEQINEMYQFYQVRRGMYVRKNQSDVCPTLTANMGTGGHNVPLIKVNDGIRKLTPQETFKLQGFPVDISYTFPTTYNGKPYSDSHLYKQSGNAVSVPIIKFLAEEILKIIG